MWHHSEGHPHNCTPLQTGGKACGVCHHDPCNSRYTFCFVCTHSKQELGSSGGRRMQRCEIELSLLRSGLLGFCFFFALEWDEGICMRGNSGFGGRNSVWRLFIVQSQRFSKSTNFTSQRRGIYVSSFLSIWRVIFVPNFTSLAESSMTAPWCSSLQKRTSRNVSFHYSYWIQDPGFTSQRWHRAFIVGPEWGTEEPGIS